MKKYQGQVYDRMTGESDGRQIRAASEVEESDQFEKIDCLCGKSFEKIDFGDVQCPYCGQIWGVA